MVQTILLKKKKIDVRLYGFDNMYMDKEFIDDKLYQIID